MIKKGIFVSAILTSGETVSDYLLCEYQYDTTNPLGGTARARTVSKQQLMAGMARGIKVENIAFTDEKKKNALKGIRRPLKELYLDVSGEGISNNFGLMEYYCYYCLGVTSIAAVEAIIVEVKITRHRRGNNITIAGASIVSAEVKDVTDGPHSYEVLANFDVGSTFTGCNCELPILEEGDSEDDLMICGENVISNVRAVERFYQLSGEKVDNELLDKTVACNMRTFDTSMAERAIEQFRNSCIDSVVLSNVTVSYDIYDAERRKNRMKNRDADAERVMVCTALALAPCSPKLVGDVIGRVVGYAPTWEGVSVYKASNGYVVVDTTTGKVMKTVVGEILDVIVDKVAPVGAKVEAGESVNVTFDGRLVAADLTEYGKTLRCVHSVVGVRNCESVGLSADGMKIMSASDGVIRYIGEADYSLPGLPKKYTKHVEIDREATLRLAKMLKDMSVPLVELAKANKCGLIAAGPGFGAELLLNVKGIASDKKEVPLKIMDGGIVRAFVRGKADKIELEQKFHIKRINEYNYETSIEGGDFLYRLLGKEYSEAEILTARHQDKWKVILINAEYSCYITPDTVKYVKYVNRWARTGELLGRNAVVSASMLMDSLKKVGTGASVSIACAIAGVLLNNNGFSSLEGQSATNQLIVPHYDHKKIVYTDSEVEELKFYNSPTNPANARTRRISYRTCNYEFRSVFNQIVDAVKKGANNISIEATTYGDVLDALVIEL